MTLLHKGNWTQGDRILVDSEIFKDDMVDDWFLMSSMWPIIVILSVYLLFVLRVGPKIMEKRKPLEMKTFILAYNLFQIFQNGRLVWLFFSHPGGIDYTKTSVCSPLGKDNYNPFFSPICEAAWYYFISKIIDLTDTVIIVLRKRREQITYLHLYHHTNMVISSWVYLKYMKSEQVVLVGVLNSFVHVVMYSYYSLTILGPSIRKHLWWKKYITQLQIVQFVMVIVFLSSLLGFSCNIMISYSVYFIADAFVFLALFTNFYIKTYVQQEKSSCAMSGNVVGQHTMNAKKSK